MVGEAPELADVDQAIRQRMTGPLAVRACGPVFSGRLLIHLRLRSQCDVEVVSAAID
jgi:hypothetical protein